ncbi:hypothetical protein Emtol_2832 [Emticicia oligotrophica DSM 17448]|uniref:Uncharacterized protein n=1 Tax=Emticicia oligotrophica (strain DSM 17448 / CIP 109782 / MTCC 6937 / GPTSA100-15) TaxID=929562 RepID=A0ABM5N3F5_EMTOG|nr:hypothetical protein Emtol_2832 [Emticicia oligotrophica DSM 17448]
MNATLESQLNVGHNLLIKPKNVTKVFQSNFG